MAMHNPRGRANYEPNGWGGAQGGPREVAQGGIRAVPVSYGGEKARIRSETFADHYSQARQFYVSQTPVERKHMADALIFELSKVKTVAIRLRMLSHLLNIHDDLAQAVAQGLGIADLPQPAKAAVPPRNDLPESPALSILKNGPDSFAGRKIGVLVTDGSDAGEVKGIVDAAKAEGAMVMFVGPIAGSVTLSDGSELDLDEKVDGAPSAVFDAVAILPSADGVKMLAMMPAARDFAATAWAHYKFAAYNDAARTLFAKAGLPDGLDKGFLPASDATGFVAACRGLRFWDRQDAA